MSTKHVLLEAAGWAGAVLILVAYAMLSAGRVGPKSVLYQGMNIVGAAGFVLNSGFNGALPSAALNVIWMGIGIWVLIAKRAG